MHWLESQLSVSPLMEVSPVALWCPWEVCIFLEMVSPVLSKGKDIFLTCWQCSFKCRPGCCWPLLCHKIVLLANGLLIVQTALLHKAFFQCMLISGVISPKTMNFAFALVELHVMSSAPVLYCIPPLMRTLDSTGSSSNTEIHQWHQ